MKMTPIQEANVRRSLDAEPGALYRNKRGDRVVATPHRHGVFNTIYRRDGETDAYGSGPIDSVRGGPWTEEVRS